MKKIMDKLQNHFFIIWGIFDVICN